MRQLGGSIPVEEIRRLKRDASQRLLGDTIGISDADWHGPSLLPGWTRAHVATHLARNADALRELTAATLGGNPTPEPSGEERFVALERGADRTGLELQIDLDTSAGALSTYWDQVTDWHRPIHLLGRTQPLAALPLARLHEVCIHHIDLDCGFTADQVDPDAAAWLLSWVHSRMGDLQLPAVGLESGSGLSGTIGDGEPQATLRGTDARLWAWLSGRSRIVDTDGKKRPRLPLLS